MVAGADGGSEVIQPLGSNASNVTTILALNLKESRTLLFDLGDIQLGMGEVTDLLKNRSDPLFEVGPGRGCSHLPGKAYRKGAALERAPMAGLGPHGCVD